MWNWSRRYSSRAYNIIVIRVATISGREGGRGEMVGGPLGAKPTGSEAVANPQILKGRGQMTSRQPGIFLWLVRSPGTGDRTSHCTFVRHRRYQRSKTCSRHNFSHVPTSLTNCFAEYERSKNGLEKCTTCGACECYKAVANSWGKRERWGRLPHWP